MIVPRNEPRWKVQELMIAGKISRWKMQELMVAVTALGFDVFIIFLDVRSGVKDSRVAKRRDDRELADNRFARNAMCRLEAGI